MTRELKKAILALERDCEFCWQELHRAIDNWADGTRAKIRAIDALSKWRKDYDKRWDSWLARGNKKLPASLHKLQDFAETHGQVHYIAGEQQHFATAKEAQRFRQATEKYVEHADAEQWYQSETNHKLMALFDRAVSENDEGLWQQLKQALKQVEAEDRNTNEERD